MDFDEFREFGQASIEFIINYLSNIRDRYFMCVCVCPSLNQSVLPQKCALQRRATRDHQSAAQANTRASGKLATGARRSGADYIARTDALAVSVLLRLLSIIILGRIHNWRDAYCRNRRVGL